MAPRAAACEYELRLRGRFDDACAARIAEYTAGMRVTETVLRGPVADQAELHGLLALLQDLGVDLLHARQAAARR